MLADRGKLAAAGGTGSAGAGLVLTWLGTAQSGASASSYNHGNFTMTAPGVLIVATNTGRSGLNRMITSVSIGGSAADGFVANGNDHDGSAIGWSEFGTAGAKNVTIGCNGTCHRSRVEVFQLTGYASATPHDTGAMSGAINFSAPYNQPGPNIAIPDGGVMVLAHTGEGNVTVAGYENFTPTNTYGAYFEEALYFATLEASSGNSGGIDLDAEWNSYAVEGSIAAASWL